ncbi:hypothetical protein D9736_22700 [Escherichia sp. E10V10]|nr:hypothetical protein D9736_22700 [Escherichia sp. E10V10]TGB61477.1 hypothetical protein CRT22_00335 [Escherichia sp. E5028]TGB80765.1 hypothetical protein CRI67_00135 [Escherichia sp. E4702]TGB81582.1 hypothetical protein CRI65_24425 [Escherichia sp. E3659]TGB97243.1 hypothetical protein CRI64_00740 [Escherichia sp. E2748]
MMMDAGLPAANSDSAMKHTIPGAHFHWIHYTGYSFHFSIITLSEPIIIHDTLYQVKFPNRAVMLSGMVAIT